MVTSLGTNPDESSTLQIREIQELSISISAQKLNPTMLSEDFLKASGIIPGDWELNKQPVLNPNYAQVSFQNGVSIATQPRNITFVETLKNLDAVQLPELVHRYIEKLPLADYQGLSIGLKSVVPLSGGANAARQYITQTLLAPGSWQEYGQAPVQAALNLVYQLEKCQLNLSINEARLQLPDQRYLPALLFSGNFNYEITSNNGQERISQLNQGIDEWKTDLEAFREIVSQRFLGQQESLFPERVIPAVPINPNS
ncbi:conserved hypothetical protein [Gloeothece citriformis PCC 7424]|uniref:Uncharacterized protein n=1 Tax=Gloeothece citriformis (strain PCC 7424) TaxID=65393 RepID=B7KGG5_GLOC7|nr:hypothetical protein [Gloeothece citriformis]ACK70636.1 conserved hypothetical protein [Gloeothece citriformis PCC 7424]